MKTKNKVMSKSTPLNNNNSNNSNNSNNNNNNNNNSSNRQKDVLENSREKGWDSSPNFRIPEYNSEKDPNCPRAMIRHYNKSKKESAFYHAKQGQGASDWIEKTIKKTFEEVPIIKPPTLREKATAAIGEVAMRQESLTEVEILQKIIVRENLLTELQKLLQFQVDLDGVFSEVIELIRALRFQTLEIIEEIARWKADCQAPRQFFYRGQNYLLKLLSDTSFLDEYDELGEHFGFYFTKNPLFYDGMIQAGVEDSIEEKLSSKYSYNSYNSQEIDGIKISRLHSAEVVLQKEVKSFQENEFSSTNNNNNNNNINNNQRKSSQSILQIGEENMKNSLTENSTIFPPIQGASILTINSGSNRYNNNTNNNNNMNLNTSSIQSRGKSPSGNLKPVKVLSDLKLKKIRMNELEEEISEIQAMHAHIEDQMTTVSEDIQVLKKKIQHMEKKKQEALYNGKMALAQKITIEEGIVSGEIDDKNHQIKDFQRKKYFLEQEIGRRRGLIKVIENEIKSTSRQKQIKNKLVKKAQKEGLLTALLSTSTILKEAENQSKFNKSDNFDNESEIQSYQISPKKGEQTFSDDDDDNNDNFIDLENDDDNDNEDNNNNNNNNNNKFSKDGSVFGFSDSQFNSLVQFSHSQVEQNENKLIQKIYKPPINVNKIISDIQVHSGIFADTVITRSLEMMWFVMVAAEDVRPKKIAIRNYVKDTLSIGISNSLILKDLVSEFVSNCLWDGYYKATDSIINKHINIARNNVSKECLERVFCIATNIVINNQLEKEDRLKKLKQILISDISKNLITNITTNQLKYQAILQSYSRQLISNITTNSINKILSNLKPVMCSFSKFYQLCEDLSIGSIGSAIYTIEMKVIPTRNKLKQLQHNNQQGITNDNSGSNNQSILGTIPVGTGFALAKAKKTAKDLIELEIYNLQTKETILHLYHSNNGEYVSIQDAINDLTMKISNGNDPNSRQLLIERVNLLYQSDINIDGRTYNLKLIKNETNFTTLLEVNDNKMKTNLKIQLTKKQEKEIEYVRDITEYIKHLFQNSLQFIGYKNLREAIIQKGGTNVLIASDLLTHEKKKVEIILQIDEITINYQPYNIKVTEDEMGFRIEVWNLTSGKVVGTRLTKRQERDFQEVTDRQQFLVNLLGMPSFSFLL